MFPMLGLCRSVAGKFKSALQGGRAEGSKTGKERLGEVSRVQEARKTSASSLVRADFSWEPGGLASSPSSGTPLLCDLR